MVAERNLIEPTGEPTGQPAGESIGERTRDPIAEHIGESIGERTEPAELLAELIALRQQVVSLEQQVSHLAQAERSQYLAQGGAAERVKDEFLTVLSHELRSPLNPILGWVRLLRSPHFDPKLTQRALDAIERNAKLQVQLIEDLLDVSQILQGKLQLDSEQVDLILVVEAAMKRVRLAAQSKQIILTPGLMAAPVWVMGDRARLQQIVWNLLSNAIKFTPPGGQVEISVAPEPKPAPNAMGAVLGCSLVQICVSDSGQGIDAEFLPYMFDYFRQADSTITRRFGGLGLGLTIVRHLVELHGGQIEAESAGIGQGAKFWVRLPLLDPQLSPLVSPPVLPPTMNLVVQSAVQSSIQSSVQSIDQVRVLLVEQNADLRDYLALVLKTAGARVACASTAGEALARLSRLQPEILICELSLPNVDGCSLLRQIRSLVPELGGQVLALALMRYAGEYSQQEILAAGFQACLTLPVEPEDLVGAVHWLVHQAG